MKVILIISAILFTINIYAQKQEEYDSIDRKDFCLFRDVQDSSNSSPTKFHTLTNVKSAEQQYGTNYKSERQFSDTVNIHYTKMVYEDGLTLEVPDDPSFTVGFRINSNKYILKLKDGTIIRAGMKVDELKAIFPKSFKQTNSRDNGKETTEDLGFFVCFSSTIKGKTIKEDAYVIFVINKKNDILKEFHTWEPI